MQRMLVITSYLLFMPLGPAVAADVFRCEDPNGHVTFTQQGCPDNQTITVQTASNPAPGSNRPVAMANTTYKQGGARQHQESLTVVAEKQDGCGNRVIGTQRRTAIIRKQIMAGMTRNDVESSLGKPDEQSSRNGEIHYRYRDNEGKSRHVSFDQQGCVKAKR